MWQAIQRHGRQVKAFGLVMALGLGTTACVTNGDDFRSDTSWIKEGQTKQPDVKMVLGEPYSVGNSSGKPTWTYGFYRYRLFGKSFQKELKFYWNPDGTLSHYSYSSSFPAETGTAGAGGSSSKALDKNDKKNPEY